VTMDKPRSGLAWLDMRRGQLGNASQLRTRAERIHITPNIRRFASEQIKYATAFLQWLGERNTTLASCGQVDIDAWFAENAEHARTLRC
jgi:hypothetical protein